MTRDPVVFLMGPTGAGKSELALRLAHRFNGEVINADSRQVYIGMDIGTDKIGRREMRTERRGMPRDEPLLVDGIPHYLIDILTPDQQYSAAQFRDDAQRILRDISRRGQLPLVVGGTGFYIRVLAADQDLPNVPPDPVFRAWAAEQPLDILVRELKQIAPDPFRRVDNLRNRRRVTRYLEIARRRHEANGIRNKAARRQIRSSPLLFLKLALLPPIPKLRERLSQRVDAMLRAGLVEETRRLAERYGASAPGLQAVGYRQVLAHVAVRATLAETRTAILRAHWDLARRQRTWLRREPRVVTIERPDEAPPLIERFLGALTS